MFKKYLQLSAMTAAASANHNFLKVNVDAQNHWAVIVAGSNGWMNYRHHADVCHAYQMMKQNGIPEDQIILFAYDDVANNSENPFPGKLFNKPTPKGTPGVDVYAGCNIDYKGSQTTAANVLKVLKGDASAGGKVLKSTEDSRVFFFYADHGAPGFVGMPTGDYLYADKLNEAFEFMHSNKMYKELAIYMESCESGSMFENILKTNINAYATSAANSHESSWGTYCSPDDKVDGVSVGSCLGDLYSVNWMENTELEMKTTHMFTETLQEQYDIVKKETTKSHVLQWGDLSFTSEPIGDFQAGGQTTSRKTGWWDVLKKEGKKQFKHYTKWDQYKSKEKNEFAVDSRDIKLHYLYNKVMKDPTPHHHQELLKYIQHRMKVDKIFSTAFPHQMVAMENHNTPRPTNFECYRDYIAFYQEKCGNISEYTLKYMKALVGECENFGSYPEFLKRSKDKLETACKMAAQ